MTSLYFCHMQYLTYMHEILNPQALSNTLAALGTLQPKAFGFLNSVDPLHLTSNLYYNKQP